MRPSHYSALMPGTTINTVTGTITAAELGATLMHEHLMVGYPGWESDTGASGPNRTEAIAICTDRISDMKGHGVRAMIDPCPNDLGRDVELMAEVSARTGFEIICATGLYKEDQGGGAYWKFRAETGGGAGYIADMYIRELTEGIGQSGVKAGIIKVATGNGRISDYEGMLLEAAAKASVATGAPITTHTDQATCGDEQQAILTGHGVPAHRIIVGHSCGTDDHDSHMRIARGGSYLGFDRFGIEILQPDELRVASLLRMLKAGCEDRVVVSHDSVWCWKGAPIAEPELVAPMLEVWNPNHFFERITPRLIEGGATEEQISKMLVHNPRRFFEGEELAAIAA